SIGGEGSMQKPVLGVAFPVFSNGTQSGSMPIRTPAWRAARTKTLPPVPVDDRFCASGKLAIGSIASVAATAVQSARPPHTPC
ncbi:TPA: hypothetical protein ACRMPF_005900, partial [Pseudomonas aeruginosa]